MPIDLYGLKVWKKLVHRPTSIWRFGQILSIDLYIPRVRWKFVHRPLYEFFGQSIYIDLYKLRFGESLSIGLYRLMFGKSLSIDKVAGVKVYPRRNRNIQTHAANACNCYVTSPADNNVWQSKKMVGKIETNIILAS